jgi:DNA invertase Pin-like site-specific DNA recombinase
LVAVAARSGWEVVGVYEDAGISGSNGREKRPGLDRLLKDATAREINMIAALMEQTRPFEASASG